ncbi:bifunctional 23S rRNA (guanine(2069)-N(7))-methyltransferase RlmK/23S rRNA (guanine(2445)-N(2))-methyltransferase RlmL [Hahella sp. KA22]|uniref:bifunctional 23S rRNA (guanine(2069)-N(7))-methyltransferase RlmK/23S rRNA (guanine(2445)-N(2))-methyltransferase RlmL n=1 Tax=Hahella sp. KA22 TaxID=1628392 RepID=UPI000FDD44CA|nr:bifunctional 23S rRNA (guanine(2069)-N(7))-methyltransferase RlmK/23S rRNA (guanine(2445)-N(2))-methyltransferase RlmL [Hahella sp. KA22]AZZ91158.1 bifunctional 23S rRNA (guanine(2069)-N(7))-methyltransferase RlmK/23S rRNA (guanine(2445)-N(2))-methyltransferase RlmL [Hahella sp. KA22]QAY54526.1 bifunctional 23S rRNA (guanine(2069)-N(7))-methyltransferase RlmK/23S rRNA (guanine(2445)-N(2))-methyltransferase RlmL [Hahella sp. KA22]
MNEFSLFASCPKGLEYVLADELKTLGAEVLKTNPAGVEAKADLAGVYRICLGSRLANRVLRLLQSTRTATRDGLYQAASEVNWSEHLRPGESYWIAAFGSSGDIRHSRFGAQVVKDAINDHFRDRDLELPVIDKQSGVQTVQLNLAKTITLGLDLAGRSLHQRGYRQEGAAAPLKENLAAAILYRAGWPELCGEDGCFVDPMCGSGTLVVEAAMIAMNVAPGLLNPHFLFEKAPWHDPEVWRGVYEEAMEKAVLGKRRWRGAIFGCDLNPAAIRTAKRNLSRAGLDRWVKLETSSAMDFTPDTEGCGQRLLVCNPPYGERLGQELELRSLYRALGRRLKTAYGEWKAGIFTSSVNLAKEIGLRADKQYHLYNGPLATTLYLFDVYGNRPEVEAPRKPQNASLEGISEQAQMFRNRLSKNLAKWSKWAKKQQLSAYRIYDADMPEYAVAIDWYDGGIIVQEYAPPKSVDEEKARQRLLDVLEVTPAVLGIDGGQLFLKQRKKQKGMLQYEKTDSSRKERTVEEHGCRFWVNLSDYLDSGLFLDHRPTRYWIQKHSSGKRFLNLFCYTGAASVHAAAGGAATTTSVDMSQTYLSWAERNFHLNKLSGPHRFVRANVLEWLKAERNTYDLIFLDPPTFSNSKKMEDVLDVQRDHAGLIEDCMRLLAPGGVLIFSCNYRRFKLDSGIEERFAVENHTAASIPEDFKRNERIHQCWHIRHSA